MNPDLSHIKDTDNTNRKYNSKFKDNSKGTLFTF